MKKQVYKKEYNDNRKRPCTIGIKLSKEEKNDLERACNKLGVNKVQFLLKAVKEVLQDE